jgi:hypothetical protein
MLVMFPKPSVGTFVVGAVSPKTTNEEESAVDTIIQVPCHLSRVAALPTAEAPALFDEWCRQSARDADAPVAVTVPGGDLVIDPESLERFTAPGYAHPFRRVGGTLRFRNRWVRDLDVEVELGPWSGTHSEVALRYAGRRVPGARRGDRFAALGSHVLDVLTARLSWYRAQFEPAVGRVVIAA